MIEETGVVLGYFAAAVLTFGYNVRNRGTGKKAVLVSLIWAAVWPLYWPITHTVSAMFKIIIGVVADIINSVLDHATIILNKIGDFIFYIYAAMAILFVPAWQLWLREDACSNLSGCMAEVAKSFLWGIVWPVALLVFDRP
jgi:hypothetical protein